MKHLDSVETLKRKRKKEIGLVVPARFSAVTTEFHIAEVLERERERELISKSYEV